MINGWKSVLFCLEEVTEIPRGDVRVTRGTEQGTWCFRHVFSDQTCILSGPFKDDYLTTVLTILLVYP